MTRTAVTLRSGTVTCVDGFLTPEESTALRDDLRHTYWWDSPVIRLDRQKRLVSGFSVGRTSSTTDETWLSPEAVQVLRGVEERLSADLGVPLDHFEPWQMARYRAGQRFEEHHDSGFFTDDPWGERTTSVLIYLSDSPVGGSTWFPTLGQRFQPVTGRLLVWPNLLEDGSLDERMRHIACPARRIKMIASTWVRQLPTRSAPTD